VSEFFNDKSRLVEKLKVISAQLSISDRAYEIDKHYYYYY